MSESPDQASCRAIVTYGRGWQSLVATRSLGKHGVEVVTGDEYAMTPSSFSKYSIADFRYPDPSAEPERFLDQLEETVLQFKPEDPETPYVLMPIHKETYLISKHRDRFEPHIRLPLPRFSDIEAVHNKGTLAQDATKRRLPIPKTWTPASQADFESLAASVELPAFVKLRESAAGVGVQKVNTLDELTATFNEFVDHFKLSDGNLPIIQVAVDGDDYCVTTLFDQGELVASMTYHNLRAFPPEKGASVMRETVDAPKMEQIARELLSPMGWHGVAQLDFRWDGTATGQPHLIEVNPRFWGGLIQAVESGWDYPWLLFELAAKGKVALQEEPRLDVRTETPLVALLATLQDIAESDTSMAKLEQSWLQAKDEVRQGGSKRAALSKLFHGAKNALDVRARVAEAKRLLNDHQDNVYDVLSKEDPLPLLGIFFPLAVFLKHGEVNMELLTGEHGPSPES